MVLIPEETYRDRETLSRVDLFIGLSIEIPHVICNQTLPFMLNGDPCYKAGICELYWLGIRQHCSSGAIRVILEFMVQFEWVRLIPKTCPIPSYTLVNETIGQPDNL